MRYILLSILITLAACNRSPYISKSEISKLTGDIVEKLLKKKAYNVDNNPDNEQSIVYTTPKGKSLAIFKKRHALATAFWVNFLKSEPLGKNCLINPFVFSLRPRCHGEAGSVK